MVTSHPADVGGTPGAEAMVRHRLFIDNNPPTVYNERREAGAGVCSNQVISRVIVSVRGAGGDTRTGSPGDSPPHSDIVTHVT